MKNKVGLLSFFSGSGFLDLGFEDQGFDVCFVNEYHTPFMDAYKYSRAKLGKSSPKYGYNEHSIDELLDGTQTKEFSTVIEKAKADYKLIGFIGGPPCPDFSVGGKNKGADGDNGRLTKSYVKLIIKHSPDYFIFENVKGLWRTKRHRQFYDSFKHELEAQGYEITDRLTNSIEFGVAQDRDRIFMVGVKRELLKGKANIEDFNWQLNLSYSLDDVLSKGRWPEKDIFVEGSVVDPVVDKGLVPLTVNYWFEKNNVLNHPNSQCFFKPKSDKFKIIQEGDDSKKSFKRLHRWRYSPTAAYGNNEVHLHPFKARRISASEALSIQSLPKDFELPKEMTLTNMFKTIGNGVPYLAAKGLAGSVKDFLDKL